MVAHIFEEGDVSVHIFPGSSRLRAHCYDERDEALRTVVIIDLLAFLPVSYGDEQDDNQIPTWQFCIRAIQVCAQRGDELWQAWWMLKNELLWDE